MLLLALTWQNFLLQAHSHPPVVQTGVSQDPGAGQSGDEQPAHHKSRCPTCLHLANATPALPSLPLAFEPPLFEAFFVAAFFVVLAATQRPAHPWQSRAPPVSLHR